MLQRCFMSEWSNFEMKKKNVSLPPYLTISPSLETLASTVLQYLYKLFSTYAVEADVLETW